MVALLKQEDREAYKFAVETWKDMVYNTVLGILQNEGDAEDVTQDVFVQVFESIDGFEERAKFSTWLYRIAISKSFDVLRRRKSRKRFGFFTNRAHDETAPLPEPVDFVHPGVKLEAKEHAAALFRALEKLPGKQKTAFVLNKLEHMSYQQVAEIMDLSVSAVDSLLQRGRQNLKKHLKTYYERMDEA